MEKINVAVIGAGWIGEIRAVNCARHPLVERLYLAEIDPAKAMRVADEIGASEWTTDYHELLARTDIDAVIVSATPENLHYPIARDCLLANKHVLLEKPMALTLRDADELIALAREAGLKLTIGYSQRYNPRYAYVKQCLTDGTLGAPVSALVTRSIPRTLGHAVGARAKLGPAQMGATHDVDFLLWCLEGSRATRVYAQIVRKIQSGGGGVPDCAWIMVTMDDGTVFTVGTNWALPPGVNPRRSSTFIEFVGTEGSILIDDSHRDLVLTTMKDGLAFPLSTMPGEEVLHVYQGPMQAETNYFIECVALDRPVLVTPEEARRVMEVTLAADLSAELGQPVDLPLE